MDPDHGAGDGEQTRPVRANAGTGPGLYRLDSNHSQLSVFEDVEMAHDELYSGPMAESLPTSIATFSHRRSRADSTASFAYYTDNDDDERDRDQDKGPARSRSRHRRRDIDAESDHESMRFEEDTYDDYDPYDSDPEFRQHRHHPHHQRHHSSHRVDGDDDDDDNEGENGYSHDQQQGLDGTEDTMDAGDSDTMSVADANDDVLHRRDSMQSRGSAGDGLLGRRSSICTDGGSSMYGGQGGRVNQKTYIVNEDMYIVIAGFRTSRLGMALYSSLCVLTLGLAWLLFRWLPRWYVRVLGQPCALAECSWVVVENQWNEMALLDIASKPYHRPLSTVFGAPRKKASYMMRGDGADGGDDDGVDPDPDPLLPTLRVLNYRYVRFFYHPLRDKFMLSSGWKDPAWRDVRAIRAGLDSEEKSQRDAVFGANLIDIDEKTVFQLLVDEVFHPFYVFQIASLVLWSLDEYYYYAVAIFAISVGSIVMTLLETRATMRRLREISRFECSVRVLRNGFWRTVSSSDLIPGDVYEISDPSLTLLPSDSLLLTGDCIVNESMLTGESVPVSKTPATTASLRALDLAAPTILPEVAKHFLFCGTKIVRARRPRDDQLADEVAALALVVRTGFNTTKGSLVRSMLFPKPSGFKFYRDSFRYISVMAVIALVGFVVSFVNFVRLGLAWHLIVVRALDLITIVVPPSLPATLTIGIDFAIRRLRAKQIFCISPQRVNVGGKIDIMCFDKTGTLTEEGLDILGVRVVDRSTGKFGDMATKASQLVPARVPAQANNAQRSGAGTLADAQRAALFTMATCHSLRSVDGELMGDPLDLKMFSFTGWAFEEGTHNASPDADPEDQGGLAPSVARPPAEFLYDLDTRPTAGLNGLNGLNGRSTTPAVASIAATSPGAFELGVVRAFEFVSQLRRASVVVRVFGQTSGDVYVKGAPECMRDICRPETLPADYDALLSSYTHKGYRVIGCATKHIPKLSYVRAQKMKRADAEAGLDFVGFIVFENKLKPTTAAVLAELQQAGIGATMVTGDNILTAISVARESGLVDRTAPCFVPHFATGHARDPDARLCWESIDHGHNAGDGDRDGGGGAFRLDEQTLLPLPAPLEGDASHPLALAELRSQYVLAVSGDVFRWIVDYAPAELLKRVLVRGRVFARMSPDEKHELVEKLQSIGYCAGFCGDGANDCAALKAADVGISLSEAEASVAAPFTSRVFDIRCVPEVIREGRASLVTSFSCFKYMSLYSAIQFTSVSFLYASASNLGDFQFLFIDLALIIPIAIFMGWAGPFPELGRKRPTADLVSRKVLTPLLGQMVICIVIQTIAFVAVRREPWYIPPVLDRDKSNTKNSENTALFLVSCFEYIFAGVVLNAGPPFRKTMWHNWPFVATIALALLFTVHMVVYPLHQVKKVMQLTKIAWDFKVLLLILGAAYLLLATAAETWLLPALARSIGRAKLALTKKPKQRKEYKLIQERMRT